MLSFYCSIISAWGLSCRIDYPTHTHTPIAASLPPLGRSCEKAATSSSNMHLTAQFTPFLVTITTDRFSCSRSLTCHDLPCPCLPFHLTPNLRQTGHRFDMHGGQGSPSLLPDVQLGMGSVSLFPPSSSILHAAQALSHLSLSVLLFYAVLVSSTPVKDWTKGLVAYLTYARPVNGINGCYYSMCCLTVRRAPYV